MRSALALLLMLLVLGPAAALAHHGDSSKVLTLTGTIPAAGCEHALAGRSRRQHLPGVPNILIWQEDCPR